VIGTNGLTKTGPQPLYLFGNNGSTLTGTISVVQNWLNVSNDWNFGAPANSIYLDGGGIQYNQVYGGTLTIPRAIYLGPSGGSISESTSTLIFTGPITGPGLLNAAYVNYQEFTKIFNPNNTFAGGMQIGVNQYVYTSTNSTLGTGDVTVDYKLFLYSDRSIGGGDYYGANTTNRQARLSVMDGGIVTFYSLAPTIGSLSGSGSITLTNNAVLTVGGDNTSTIYAGIISQSTGSGGSLYKTGSGTFRFKGRNVCTGTTTVAGGEFAADGFMAGGITVNSGATLSGAGSVGPVTINSGATLQTGSTNTSRIMTLAGALTLASGSTFIVNLNGTNQFDQIAASGAVNLSGATLQVNLNYAPSAADTFQIVTSPVSITGTFVGLPNNSLIHFANNYVGRITYTANAVTISSITKGLYGSVFMLE
jgi:autotransporter-associated beta strand protein